MISFRYHIVTIVAVFLAMGLGLLVGNTVVQPSLVNDLERQSRELRKDLEETRAEVTDLRTRTELLEAAGDIAGLVDDGTLADVPVVVLTQEGVSGDLLAQTRRVLDDAGAQTVAVLSVTAKMAGIDDISREALAGILGAAPDTELAELQASAAELLAQRLAEGGSRADGSLDADVLDELLRANFLDSPPPGITSGDVPKIGGRDQVVVVVAGGVGEPAVDPEAFMVLLVEGLLRHGVRVAAGESATTDYAFVGPLRSDDSIPDGSQMVTVDDLDFPIGGAALVLGLERLLATGEGGNYGVKGDPPDVLPIPPST